MPVGTRNTENRQYSGLRLSQINYLITQHATEGLIQLFTEFDVLKIDNIQC